MLSEKNINKFQNIYKNKSGKEISSEEARERGTSLLRLVELIYKPINQKEYDELQKRRNETEDLIISKT